jgi:transposase-like protein
MKAPKRTMFSREFKLEAVRLVQSGKKTVSQIARELGVARQLLHTWVREAESDKADAFPGNGKRSAADAEIALLRKELAQAKEDNEILKKAAAFFAKNTR